MTQNKVYTSSLVMVLLTVTRMAALSSVSEPNSLVLLSLGGLLMLRRRRGKISVVICSVILCIVTAVQKEGD